MKKFLLSLCFTLVALLGPLLGLSCSRDGVSTGSGRLSGDLIVFHAGSLSIPFKEVVSAFKKMHPGVNIMCEAAGSRTCARKICDLGRLCDVMASADYSVIEALLIPHHA